jgi:hypothetical protein
MASKHGNECKECSDFVLFCVDFDWVFAELGENLIVHGVFFLRQNRVTKQWRIPFGQSMSQKGWFSVKTHPNGCRIVAFGTIQN